MRRTGHMARRSFWKARAFWKAQAFQKALAFRKQRCFLIAVASAVCAIACVSPKPSLAQPSQTEPSRTEPSRTEPSLAQARFASLKTDRVVVRQGPASDSPVLWTFHRLGWPVRVLRETGAFSEVQDSDGAVGWVSTLHLSGRRTAIVVGAAAPAAHIALRFDNRDSAGIAAQLEPGLQAVVVACDGRWCRLVIGDVRGWLEQSRLWGVAVGERIE